jgi:hypothetical protein
MQRLDGPTFEHPRVPDVVKPRTNREGLPAILPCDHVETRLDSHLWAQSDPLPMGTNTDRALRRFMTQVRNLPGVLRVEQGGSQAMSEQAIRVYLREGDTDAEYRVYHLKGEIYRRYPEARLDVDIAEDNDVADTDSAALVGLR